MPIDSSSRRLEAQRQRRRSVRSFAGVLAASLTLAATGTAAAQSTGGTQAGATSTASSTKVTVKQIQGALGIKADGAMGPQTRAALKRFQRAHHLRVTGTANKATLGALGLSTPQQNSSLASTTADPATLLAEIAQCESQGNLQAVSPDGRYFGKYQFSQATWEALGGTGSPADADESTQDLFAARLYSERGLAPWPACSAQLSQS